jgi:putative ubiquitin-RnfH superfamily antitoxin RatB of RatAB toxin-antitoxin module
MTSGDIDVTVVFALPDRVTEIALRLPAGATVADALARSDIFTRHPEADIERSEVGVFGKRADRHCKLVDGDRVEVYRALVVGPMERRSSRAAARRKQR